MAEPTVKVVRKQAPKKGEGEVAGEVPEKKKIPLWIFLVAGSQIVVFSIIGYFVSQALPKAPVKAPSAAESKEAKPSLPGPHFAETSMVINLKPEASIKSYVKMEMEFQFETEDVRDLLSEKVAEIREELIFLLSSKSAVEARQELIESDIFTLIHKIVGKDKLTALRLKEYTIHTTE